jgi:hypothetical protein
MPTRGNAFWVRGAAVLAATVVTIGALAISPAGGAADGLSRREKRQGDKRWINAGEKAADADKLDGLDSSELSPGVGVTRTNDAVLTSQDQTVLSATLTTKGNATLVSSASLKLNGNGGDDDAAVCHFRLDGGLATSPDFTSDIPETVNDTNTMPLVWAQSVGPGAHTVEVRCFRGGNVVVVPAALTVSAHV